MSAARTIRIAAWSGPRNISTALMRSWENRSDTRVWDEPFYACYLQATGVEHPMREAVIAAGETDWRKVIARLAEEPAADRPVFYQKHMSHHLLPGVDRDWLSRVTNCFLIRDPREVALSYHKARQQVVAEDLGFAQQAEIYDHVRGRLESDPVVIDAADFLRDPQRMLRLWCDRLGLAFQPAMLSWPAGPRDSDGVWGRHWYANVWNSTGFQAYTPRREPLPRHLEPVVEACRPHYERLHAQRLGS